MKVILRRYDFGGRDICDLGFTGIKYISPDFCWKRFSKLFPKLTKGMRKDQNRELILTETKYGIKLELAKKSK